MAGRREGGEEHTGGEHEAKGDGGEDKRMQEKRDRERSDTVEESIIYWQDKDEIPESLETTKNTLKEVVGLGSSFDIVFREMTLAGQSTGLFFINGFAKDNILVEILKRLTYLSADQLTSDALKSFFDLYIPHIQVEMSDKLSAAINKALMGMCVLFIEGEQACIIMDTRSYPVRSPEEPSIERVVRGARDGFTETLLTNIALVRRRIRDPGFKSELVQVGRRTRTDVCIAYIDDIVDKVQVDSIRKKIKSIDIDGLPQGDKQLEEAIINKGWHPYPLVRYSERPDVVASHILEGRVVVFVDTSPSVMVMPTTFFDLCQHAEENRQTAFMGTYLRWVRFLGIFASMFLLPLWMLLVTDPYLKPQDLIFIGPHDTAKIPLIAQFLLVEFGVDLLRLAAVHTPTPLASAMGLIAAILVGDIAVKTGLFVNEVVLYMAVAAIGMFATPSYELGLANRMVRLVLLVAVAIFKVQGFVVGTTLLILLLTLHRSYNSSYLWPFIPFNAKALSEVLLRFPVLESKKRPSFNKTRDNTRMAKNPDNREQS
ncbi:spore germination protein [Paenibacillus rhizosphaerae]|nr:spore germination protein [Paenibacillus rhizosphaerae]